MTTVLNIVRVDPYKLLRGGLAMWVNIMAVPKDGPSKVDVMRVGAIIDTGAACSGISEKIFNAFTDAETGTRKIMTPTFGRREEPTIRCSLLFDTDPKIEMTEVFSLIRELEPHDVLIGRDLMMKTKLTVDFPKGEWSWVHLEEEEGSQ